MATRELLIYRFGFMAFHKKQVPPQRETTHILGCTAPGHNNFCTGKFIAVGAVTQPTSRFVVADAACRDGPVSIVAAKRNRMPDCVGSILETNTPGVHSGEPHP